MGGSEAQGSLVQAWMQLQGMRVDPAPRDRLSPICRASGGYPQGFSFSFLGVQYECSPGGCGSLLNQGVQYECSPGGCGPIRFSESLIPSGGGNNYEKEKECDF